MDDYCEACTLHRCDAEGAHVRTLALTYADHPDFRPEWRTGG